MFEKFIPAKVKRSIFHVRKQVKNFRSLALDYGQWRSIRDWTCLDSSGRAIPWYTYPAIEYLSHLDFTEFRVFEYGSGKSTLWWSNRAQSVLSVEDDKRWFSQIVAQIRNDNIENVTYELHSNEDSYVTRLAKPFDIVVIDGKFRAACTDRFLELSKDSLMLILDNAEREPAIVERVRKSLQWIEVDFHGFGPINNYTWTTSIFLNPEKIKQIKYKTKLNPISGLPHNGH